MKSVLLFTLAVAASTMLAGCTSSNTSQGQPRSEGYHYGPSEYVYGDDDRDSNANATPTTQPRANTGVSSEK